MNNTNTNTKNMANDFLGSLEKDLKTISKDSSSHFLLINYDLFSNIVLLTLHYI